MKIDWDWALGCMDFAFQPIVNIHTGVCFGCEALLRGWEGAGFTSIAQVFDKAYEEGVLFTIDRTLKDAAIEKYLSITNHQQLKLFLNLDNRAVTMPENYQGLTSDIFLRYGLNAGSICLELSERHTFPSLRDAKVTLGHYKHQAFKIAIDDFGTGFSGLQLLYHAEPDFIKMDRFFISGIETDSRKRLFVSKVVSLAHILGIVAIAEGVETQRELFVCKESGFDYVQGFFVQRPSLNVKEIRPRYDDFARLTMGDMRDKSIDQRLLNERMDRIEPIYLHEAEQGYLTDMSVVFDAFRRDKSHTFKPVLNGNDEPVGIIREKDLKEYVYSRYGKDLLMNRASGKTIRDFVIRCPISEVNTKIEKILELFALDHQSDGIILTQENRFVGFLTTTSLLQVINEKNLAVARDQNPLTRLPGNTLVKEFIDNALDDELSQYCFVYFDFDNFKPFNDRYGFRLGDRAILMFADILNECAAQSRLFRGHLGGDDFFIGFSGNEADLEAVMERAGYIQRKFANDVVCLYDEADRVQGFITGKDREGYWKRFPLLTVSTAIIHMAPGTRDATVEDIGLLTAELKGEAKRASRKIAARRLATRDTDESCMEDRRCA